MVENISGIKWALGALKVNAGEYIQASEYYDGKQRLSFATDKFRNTFGRLFQEMAINHCAVCVDVPADRLQIQSFKVVVQGESTDVSLDDGADVEADKIREIWRRNRMNKRGGEVHAEMLKTGDSYIVVDWKDDVAMIYPNQAGRVAVQYDDENPGYIKQAARWWVVGDPAFAGKFRVCLNLYYRDRIEKYQLKRQASSDLPLREANFEVIEGDWYVPNKYGKVPVFHFANNADIGSLGRSEIRDIIAPQDGYNKAICDAMVGAEFAAMGQRYAIGLELPTDDNGNVVAPFRDGMDKLWIAPPQRGTDGNPLPSDQAQPISFGQFAPANLEQLLKVKESFRNDISVISGIPAHYFMQSGGTWPSGESLKTAEQRLTSKVCDRQIASGNVWEDVMRFCLEIEGMKNVQLECVWKDTSPHSADEVIKNAASLKNDVGLPMREVLRTLGYQDSQIDKIFKELDAQNVKAIAA